MGGGGAEVPPRWWHDVRDSQLLKLLHTLGRPPCCAPRYHSVQQAPPSLAGCPVEGGRRVGERGGLHVAAAMAVVIIPSRSARRLKPALAYFLRAVMPDMLGVQKGDKSLRN